VENLNNPYFDKIIVPKKQRDAESIVHGYVTENVETFGAEGIEYFEIEKTAKDIEIIQFVEKEIDELLSKYGRTKNITVSPNNIHLLKEGGTEEYTDGNFATGAYSPLQKSIIVDRLKSDLQFALLLFHELLHLKSYSALQVLPDKAIETYRSGISVVTRDGETKYLNHAEEGIISYLALKFFDAIKTNKLFSNEINQNPKEVIYSRQTELLKLYSVVDKIFEMNSDIFQNKEQIFELFIDAQVNGRLLRLTRLIKKTFGIDNIKEFLQFVDQG